jgi:hypothetical protein
VQFDEAFDGGDGGVKVDVFPFRIFVDHCSAIVDGFPDLFLICFGRISVSCTKIVSCNEILNFILVLYGGENLSIKGFLEVQRD